MNKVLDYRPWDELTADTLGLIFSRLPLDEILDVIPRVCKSWAKAVMGPYCWQEIDIEDWSRYRRAESIDRMLLLLISRSSGALRKLCVYGLSTSASLFLIADHAKSLQNLRLPRSEITDSSIEQVARRFPNLTSLDLSYCTKLGAPALETLGKHCKFLTHLQRNMHPWDVAERTSQDDEAFAIASSMPRLKHLELAYLMVTTESVVRIISECHQLELLDMRGCWNVKLDEELVKCFSNLKVVGPLVVDSNGKKGDRISYYPHGSSMLSWDIAGMDDYMDDNDDDGDDDDLIMDDDHDMGDYGLEFYDEFTGAGL